MSAVMEAVRATELAQGTSHEVVKVRFGFWWSVLFFLLSGDKNWKIHGISGDCRRYIQGVAIMTKFGTTVSTLYPGFMVRTIGEMTFKSPVCIGETITFTFTDFKEKKPGIVTVMVNVTRDGRPVLKPLSLLLVKAE